MESYVVIVTSLLSLVQLSSQHLNLPQGASCQDGWICATPDECSVLGNMKISRPEICSFKNNQPILCCPPINSSPQPSTKAAEMCSKYKTNECYYRIKKPIINSTTEKNLIQVVPVVVGGYYVSSGSHRHMALIGYSSSESSLSWQCGGSIISNNFILSAAHCVKNNAGELASWVKVGDLDLSTTFDDAKPVTHRISQRIIHPDFKPPAFYSDIALFRLDRPLVFNRWVGPACLFTQPEVPTTHATVTGWGRIDFVGETSNHLLAADLPLVPTSNCKDSLGTSSKIPYGVNTDSMICAGEKEGGKDACSGDSGGPLVINTTACVKTQIGVTSFGRMCGLPDTPAVYTRIYPFLPWIQSIVWP